MGKSSVRDIFEPLRKKFNELDKANNGHISKEEFVQAIEECGVDAETAKFDDLFESFDVGHTGDISVSEFITTLGAPLIRSPKATVDDVFKETTRILLNKLENNKLEKQWSDLCSRFNLNPNRGTLDYKTFKGMLEKECDWKMSDMQVIPIFHYLDLNNNGLISMITLRFLVTEMAKQRGKGRTVMVIDVLKQALSAAQAEMIMKQSESVVKLNRRLESIRASIRRLRGQDIEVDVLPSADSDVHVRSPSVVGKPGYPEFLLYKKPRGSIGSRFLTWPLVAILFWLGTLIIYITSIFSARPVGEIGIDLNGLIISGIIASSAGLLHAIYVWPFRKIDCKFSVWKLGMSLMFALLAAIYFVLGITFFMTFWYKDKNCFACRACSVTDDTVCWGDWKLLGDWQDTCKCSLNNEVLWEDANFDFFSDLSDCNSTLYASHVFDYNGDSSTLETCMFYEDGLYMELGPPMIAFTLLSMISGSWGFLKNIKEWSKSKLGHHWEEESDKGILLTIDYGATTNVADL